MWHAYRCTYQLSDKSLHKPMCRRTTLSYCIPLISTMDVDVGCLCRQLLTGIIIAVHHHTKNMIPSLRCFFADKMNIKTWYFLIARNTISSDLATRNPATNESAVQFQLFLRVQWSICARLLSFLLHRHSHCARKPELWEIKVEGMLSFETLIKVKVNDSSPIIKL